MKLLFKYLTETSIYEIIKDKDFARGISGSLIALIVPMLDKLTHIFQFFGAAGGVLLVFLSIRHKILEIKKLKKSEKNGTTGNSNL